MYGPSTERETNYSTDIRDKGKQSQALQEVLRRWPTSVGHAPPLLTPLDDRYTDGGPGIQKIHGVSGLVSDTLDTQAISKSMVTVRYTGYTCVSSQVSDTLDTYLSSRVGCLYRLQ